MEFHIHKVGSESLSSTESMMRDIYNENPKHWPNGLTTSLFDGGLWMVRSASSNEPAGFVGWQERREGFKKVGYYSIGIKKKHRRKGYAREAIKKVIRKKANNVDIVRAYIVEDNTNSINLAKQLPVELELEKAATAKLLKEILKKPSWKNIQDAWQGSKEVQTAGGFLGGAGMGGLESWAFDYDPTATKINTFLTGVMGAAFPHMRGKGKMIKGPHGKKLELATANVPKMGVIAAVDMADKYIKSQRELADTRLDTAKLSEETAKVYQMIVDKYGLPALIGTGILGTGATAALLIHALRERKPTKITMTGPKNRGGKSNVISVDIPRENISEDFYRSLSRDLLFDSPAEKIRKAKKILKDSEHKKKASIEKKAALTHGKNILKLLGGGARQVGGEAGRFLGTNEAFWSSMGKLGLGAAGLYGTLKAHDAATGKDWANGVFKWLGQPITDAAKDFSEGKLLHGIGNLGMGALWSLPAVGALGFAGRIPMLLAGMGAKGLGRTLAGSSIRGKMPKSLAGLSGMQRLGAGTYNIGRKFKDWGQGLDRAADAVAMPIGKGLSHMMFRPFGDSAHKFGTKWLQVLGATRPNTMSRLGVHPWLGMGSSFAGMVGIDALRQPLSRESRNLDAGLKASLESNRGILPKGWGHAAAKMLGADPYSAA